MFLNLKKYLQNIKEDVFQFLPITFHVKDGIDDPEFTNFKNYF